MEEIAKKIDKTIRKDARQDALQLTKRHLEGFRSQQRYVSSLNEDIQDRYVAGTKMCATYGEQIGHSSLVKLEHGAMLAFDEEHQKQKVDYVRAKHLSERIEQAVGDLPDNERVILQQRYIDRDRETWEHIADVINLDKRWCYRLHNRGLSSVATSLFGLTDVLVAEQIKRANRR